MSDPLDIWTVYDHPADYDGFIARRFEVLAGFSKATLDIVTGATLDEVRDKLPRGLYPLPRSPGDDPMIVECWL